MIMECGQSINKYIRKDEWVDVGSIKEKQKKKKHTTTKKITKSCVHRVHIKNQNFKESQSLLFNIYQITQSFALIVGQSAMCI